MGARTIPSADEVFSDGRTPAERAARYHREAESEPVKAISGPMFSPIRSGSGCGGGCAAKSVGLGDRADHQQPGDEHEGRPGLADGFTHGIHERALPHGGQRRPTREPSFDAG